jgi:exosortase E/protease (VPEID-CTERM system)
LYVFSAVLLTEYAIIVSVDHPWCTLHRVVAGAIVFVSVFLFVATPLLRELRSPLPLNRRLLALYGACLVVIAFSHAALLHASWAGKPIVAIWFVAIVASATSLLCALIPPPAWPGALRRTRLAWIYAAVASLIAVAISDRVNALWNAPHNWGSAMLQRSTFHIVAWILKPFYPSVHTDPTAFTISLPNFDAAIAGSCSGIEGLCLTLLFTAGWLWYARRELRFPRALLLVPCALALIWALNILRIATLLVIANSGYADVAVKGFHSEAGWIAFNTVALGFLAVANRLPWLARQENLAATPMPAPAAETHRNVAAIYLLPFLAILAAASLSNAVSSGFEWAYPLRFIAAAVVLWHFRSEYRRIDWTFTWAGPLVGAAVFAMWLALSRWSGGAANTELGTALAALPTPERVGWLAVRIAAAVITVPIAEELAFRGFLLRRTVSAEIESVAYRAVTPLALLSSSAAFGLMHGKQWLAGAIAGLAYALLVKRTARLGEAAAAHATTNLLLAIWVLTHGAWSLW